MVFGRDDLLHGNTIVGLDSPKEESPNIAAVNIID